MHVSFPWGLSVHRLGAGGYSHNSDTPRVSSKNKHADMPDTTLSSKRPGHTLMSTCEVGQH